jgi:hypothetical protein
VWQAQQPAFQKILRREPLNVTEFLDLDDSDFVFHIKQWQKSSDPILSDLCRRFINRKLLKAIDLDMLLAERTEFLSLARDVVRKRGFDPTYYFIEDHAGDVPYYSVYTTAKAEPKTHIFVEDGYAHPQIREISEISDVVRGLQHGYQLHRICFPAEVKDEVYALYHRQIGASS